MDATRAAIADPLGALKDLIPDLDVQRVQKALFSAEALYGNKTMELLPDVTLLEHAVRTARFLAEFCRDEDAVIACILQHALKCGMSLSELGREFGRPVRDIASRIHLLSHLYTTDWRKSVEDLRIMLVSVADDVRVLLITLSVSCVLLDLLPKVKADYRIRLCRQSLQLFAPVAARLGIYALKYRLERAAFPECYAVDAQNIDRQLKLVHAEHGQFLNRTAGSLRDFLREEGIEAQVMAREKQPYSIFQKMHSKSVSALEKITDLFAIRVIVPTSADCYQALGHLHRLGTPISHRFKDYISFPKPNGYQSLHTSLLGLPHSPKDVIVEVQIRTPEMHQAAEYGVAAHWMYKQPGKGKVMRSANQLQLSDVLLKQQALSDDSEKQNDGVSFADHIYVLTPRGDIIELPEGGTPLDFAFTLHTDLGLKYKAARVNGGIVPISYKLENGDVIEIMTHKYPRPTLQWLEELVTSSARSKLKAYFSAHNRSQFLLKGKDSVNAELKLRGLPSLDNELSMFARFDSKNLSMKEREDLLVKLGIGSVRTSSIFRHLPAERTAPRRVQRKKIAKKAPITKNQVAVDGDVVTMPHRFAKCCSPHTIDPRPEKLLGVVGRTGSVVVHKDGCRMAKGVDPQRKLKMHWVA